MPSEFITDLTNILTESGIAKSYDFEGFTPEQVAWLEQSIGRDLPRTYKEFLLAMGYGAGSFFRGTDMFTDPDDMLEIHKSAADTFYDATGLTLPDNAFVMYLHQGYLFAYFLIDGSDDPPVYSFSEADPEVKIVNGKLSEFFLSCAAEEAEIHKRLREHVKKRGCRPRLLFW
jgi:hypothetical protein